MATVDNLTLEISADSQKAITSLNNLSTALNNLKRGLPTKAKLENSAQGFKTLTEAISKLSLSAKNLDKIKAISTIAKNLSKLNSVNPSKLKATAENLDSLQGAMSHISYQAVEKIERLASAFSKLGEANKNIGSLKSLQKTANISAQAQPVETTTTTQGDITAIGKIKNEADEATKSVGGFWTKFQTVQSMVKANPISLLASSESAEGMANLSEKVGMSIGVLTTLSKVLGWVGLALSITTFGLKMFSKAINFVLSPIKKLVNGIKTLVKAFARIALYRGIRGLIKSITQGVKEGIQNLALYSKALEGLDAHNANNVMSRYASEFLYFKNVVATAVIPVLRALIPYVETAINTMIKFINVLAQVGSAIFGTTYTKAKYFWVDYADSLDTASGSAKKLHHQLAGFDELNNLTDSRGGSGTDKLQDALNMFEEADIDSRIKNWVDGITIKIKSGIATVKTAIQPFVDKLKEVGKEIKERVFPNVKKIWENIKRIWNSGLKPIITGFLEGFFKNIDSEFLNNLPNILERISIRVEQITGNLATLSEKIPNDKLKNFGENIGTITAKILYILNPFNALITINEALYKTCEKIDKIIKDALVKTIDKITQQFIILKPIIDVVGSSLILLSNPTTSLSSDFGRLASNILLTKDRTSLLGSVLDAIRIYFNSVNPFKKIQENATSAGNILLTVANIVNWFKTLGTITLNFAIQIAGLDKLQQITNKVSSPATTTINSVSKLVGTGHARANGGYVPKGDLFVANEKTPEMIGHIGGNTAVANNNQITEAIASATYTAMSKALSENNGNVTFVVEGDADKMFKVYQKKQREYQKTTGFAY